MPRFHIRNRFKEGINEELKHIYLIFKIFTCCFAATEAKKHEANKARKFCFYIYWLNTKHN